MAFQFLDNHVVGGKVNIYRAFQFYDNHVVGGVKIYIKGVCFFQFNDNYVLVWEEYIYIKDFSVS